MKNFMDLKDLLIKKLDRVVSQGENPIDANVLMYNDGYADALEFTLALIEDLEETV